MLPPNITEAQLAQQSADRQTNYLILRSLESKLPGDQFQTLLTSVTPNMTLPLRTVWDGRELPSSYEELKQRQGAQDESLLTNLVHSFTSRKNTNFDIGSSKVQTLTNFLKQRNDSLLLEKPNVLACIRKSLTHCHDDAQKALAIGEIAKIERVKTVFSHVDFSKDEVSPIYNVQFDQTGSFIVSAADDGVIKVWDRDTLTLQASLHAHFDYITWIIISNCNKYIVSAGNDAQIIIWELATGKIVQKLTHHTKLINVIKFFCPRSSQNALDASQHSRTPEQSQGPIQPIQQYLFSCSDDGTVRIYDFTQISGWNKQGESHSASQTAGRTSEEEAHRVRRSSRQNNKSSVSSSAQTESVAQEGLYTIELAPNDYRPGVKSNKKLENLVMNHNGLVIAGSGSGEVFVWRLDYDSIQKRMPKQDCHIFLGSFKMPKQSGIKFCEFQPNKGVPGVGDTLMTGSGDGVVKLWSMKVGKWKNQQRQQLFDLNDKSRLILQIDESKGCLLSKQIVSIDPATGDEEIDWILEEVPSEGAKPLDFKFSKSQCDQVRWSINGRFAISSITSKVDNNSGDEICRIKIWDQVDQTFYDDLGKASGILLKKFIYVLAAHPIQEELLMSGSEGGLLILWNLRTKQALQKFEQYGVYSVDAGVMDNPLDGKWAPDGRAFVTGNNCGTITLYSCEDKKHQYEATRVHQFFQFDFSLVHQRDNPFEKIQNRPSICDYNMMPYEVQPQKSLIRFSEVEANQDPKKFNRDLQLARELGTMEEKYYQDQLQSYLSGNVIPNQFSQDVDMVGQAPQQQMIRLDQQSDSDEEQERRAQVIRQEQQNRGQQANRGRPRLQRNNERGVSARQVPAQIVSPVEESSSQQEVDSNSLGSESLVSESEELSDLDEVIQPSSRRNRRETTGRSGRPQRAARPSNLRDVETVQDEESVDARVNRRRNIRRDIEASSLQSYVSSLDDDDSPEIQRHQRFRPEPVQNHRNRNQRQVNEFNLDPIPNNRGNRGRPRGQIREEEDFQPEKGQVGVFYMSDNDLPQQRDDKADYTSHMLSQVNKNSKDKSESSYELQKQGQRPQNVSCSLCKRIDGEIVGPFVSKKSQIPVYLHKDCIEINAYSYFNSHSAKWVKIEQMLKHLKEDAQYTCFRCQKEGASISCLLCGKCFHGYYCCGIYNIIQPPHDQKEEGPNTAICLFCQNQNNNEDQTSPPGKLDKDVKSYLTSLKQIDRSNLLRCTNFLENETKTNKQETYSPQIDDVLLYFFQGHENYIYQYNCHFYAGQQNIFPSQALMPWFQPRSDIRNQEIAIVKVISIKTLFPSRRSIALMNQFGQGSSDCVQEPKMIQRIELQFVDSDQVFFVDMFQNELPDFLILYQVFNAQRQAYQSQSLVGKTVSLKTKSGQKKVRIVEESPLEATLYPKSLWQTVVCVPVSNQTSNSRPTRNQSSDSQEAFRVNFWDIVYEKSEKPNTSGFKEHELSKLKATMRNFMTKQKDYLVYFSERVQEKIAPEYRQTIPQEMWFGLILQRLENDYYRSPRQLIADIDLIVTNAEYYNGKKHEIAIDAGEVAVKIKGELQKCFDRQGENHLKQKIAEATSMFSSAILKSTLAKELNKRSSTISNQEIQIDTSTARQQHYRDIEENKDEQMIAPAKLGRRNRQVDDSLEVEMFELEKASSSNNQNQPISESRTLRKRQRIV